MRVLVVENYPATPAGLVGKALAEAGVEIDTRRAHLREPLPADPENFDGIVILGGEQNALADEACPWLPGLVALARAFGESDRAVLGICLGAQLVARAFGGENLLARPVEFGWREVRPTVAGRDDPLIAGLGEGSPFFHWHEDTFSLPAGATHLASSDMTAIQAFRLNRAVYGIQFHFEADRAVVAGWSEEFAATIHGYAPDWPERRPFDAARYGLRADETGLDLARRWVRLVKRGGAG